MPLQSLPTHLATVVARRVTVHRDLAPVLVDVDVTVGPEHRIGVIGPNGVGKTTLLRVLAGLQDPDSGNVRRTPPAATVGYLAQETDVAGAESLADHLARRTGVGPAERELADAAAALASGAPGADDRYSAALERYLALGAADFEPRRGEIMDELGLEGRLLDVPVATLSGGQRAKASLASLLLSRFDVLLLDEPTNDLDFDGLDRLRDFVRARQGGLVVVSHDRAFLEDVVTSVLEIDEATHRAALYAGGYAAYLEARATARRHAEEAYRVYVEQRERLRDREREQRQWAVQGVGKEKRRPRDNDKAQRDFRINRTQKQASKVRSTERALERLEAVDKPFEPWVLDLDLKEASRSGDVVARLEAAVVERGTWRLGPVDLELRFGERVAVLGSNGSGKTTLIGALFGEVPLHEGRSVVGPSVVVGSLGQARRRFSGTGSDLVDEFRAATGLSVPEGRSLLAKFGLGASHVERPAASLSPGERTRAELAVLMAAGTNCLVLDEPTNHLDLPAIEQLEEALGHWRGTLILVTHDAARSPARTSIALARARTSCASAAVSSRRHASRRCEATTSAPRRLLDAVILTRRLTLDDGGLVGDVAV